MNSNFKKIINFLSFKSQMQEKQQLSAWNQEQYENLKALVENGALDEKIASLQDYKVYDKAKAFERITGESFEQESKVIKPGFAKYAAAASMLLVVLSTALYFGLHSSKPQPIEYATAASMRQISLPDASSVTLDKNSTLVYTDTRSVSLEGRAQFSITKDASHPFVIHTAKGNVTVLGTVFTVWSTSEETEIAVLEGKVRFDYDGRSVILEQNQRMKLVGNDIVSSNISSANQFSWVQETLQFRNTPIDVVLSDLSRHYGQTIKLSPTLKNKPKCLLTSSFKKESIEDVLAELKTLFDISIVKRSNEYVITAINC